MAPHSKENSTQQTKEELFEEKTKKLNQTGETALKNNKIIIYMYYHFSFDVLSSRRFLWPLLNLQVC